MNADDELLDDLKARTVDPSHRKDVTVESFVPLAPPVTPETIAATESEIGFALHPLLVRVYTEVANGGFGPGYGLLPLSVPGEPEERTLSSVYREFRGGGGWPEKLLPLWDWGGAAWSCLDGTSSEGIIVTHDDRVGPTETSFTLRSWLQSWVAGVDMGKEIYEDKERVITNPFTKKPVTMKVYGVAKGKTWIPRS
jgi:hypothetical protein